MIMLLSSWSAHTPVSTDALDQGPDHLARIWSRPDRHGSRPRPAARTDYFRIAPRQNDRLIGHLRHHKPYGIFERNSRFLARIAPSHKPNAPRPKGTRAKRDQSSAEARAATIYDPCLRASYFPSPVSTTPTRAVSLPAKSSRGQY